MYEVLTKTVFSGWVNCWMDDENLPIAFKTEREAVAAMDEEIEDRVHAGMSPCHFKVGKVG